MGGGVCEVEWGQPKHQEWKRHLKGGWYIRDTVPAGRDLVFSARGKPYGRSQVWWPREPQDSRRRQDSVPGFLGCSVDSSWGKAPPFCLLLPTHGVPNTAFQLVSFNPPAHPMLARFNTPLPRHTRELFISSVVHIRE